MLRPRAKVERGRLARQTLPHRRDDARRHPNSARRARLRSTRSANPPSARPSRSCSSAATADRPIARALANNRESFPKRVIARVVDPQAAPRFTPTLASAVSRAVASTAARAAPLPRAVLPAVARAAPRAVPGARGFAATTTISDAASALEQRYSAPLRYLHWLIAGGTLGAFATVQLAQRAPPGKTKGDYMFLHKSLGLLVLGLTAPRLAVRLTSAIPAAVPGSFLEQTAASAGHALMYAFLIGMPATGFVMGYFGGKGLPFFTTVIPGAATRDGKLAGRAFKLHKQMGYYYQLFVPLHVGAVGVHALKGQNIMRRMGVTAFG